MTYLYSPKALCLFVLYLPLSVYSKKSIFPKIAFENIFKSANHYLNTCSRNTKTLQVLNNDSKIKQLGIIPNKLDVFALNIFNLDLNTL